MRKNPVIPMLVPIALSGMLVACGGGDDGNPNAGDASVNYTTSRLGMSGGFVDVNGDGKKDLIVGAPEAKASSKKTGVATVYLAGENGIEEKASAVLEGEGEGDFFGFSFTNLGDVNGDSKNDFAIGALNAEGEAGISGAVYVYKGGENPPVLLAKLKGLNAFDKFGYSITSGDVNGDGLKDILVSSPHTFNEDYQSGVVSVYFGGESIAEKADVMIRGDKVNASVGQAVASGDINGDNIDDIIMDVSAKVYIYYGGADIKTRIADNVTPNVKIRSDSGGHGGSGFGYALAYAGDVDGDGYGDIAVSNPRRSNPATYDSSGSFYIFKGGKDLPAEFFEDNTDYRLVKVTGADMDDHLGSFIRNAGDVDGGGKPDFLVGANWANGGDDGKKMITGNIFLFHGEDLVVSKPEEDQAITLAKHAFPMSDSSSEYGGAIDSDGHLIFSGTPGANRHDGGYVLTYVHDGKAVVVDENASNASAAADPHAGHH